MLGLACLVYILGTVLVGGAVYVHRLKTQKPLGFSKLALILGAPLVLTAIGCYLPLYIPRWLNDYRLHRFAQNLYAYPLPPQTAVISQHSEVRLMGNSNHCDFLAEQTLISQLTRLEIEAYYAEVQLPPAREDSQWGEILVHLKFLKPENQATGLKFVVSILDYDNPPELDFRCH